MNVINATKSTAFEVGDMVSVKTTGEEGIVRGISSEMVYGNICMQYTVRLPRITRDGILHVDTGFAEFELETRADGLLRDLVSMKKREMTIMNFKREIASTTITTEEKTVSPETKIRVN